MKRLAFALVLASLTGLLWSALAQTNQTALIHYNSLSKAHLLTRFLWSSPAHANGGSSPAQINQPAVTHHVSLSKAQVSQVENNRIIVTMRAEGDLPGALTLVIDQNDTDHTIVGGDWALVIPGGQDVNAGQAHEDSEDDAHSKHAEHSGERLDRSGVLKGTISGGTVTLNADGTVASVDSVQLNIDGGTLAYDNVTNGNGIAHGTSLQDFSTSSGTLSLNF